MSISLNGIVYCSLTAYMFERKNQKKWLRLLTIELEALVTLNLLTVILFPNGLYLIYGFNKGYSNAAYLLGHRNNAIEHMIPLTGICIINDI